MTEIPKNTLEVGTNGDGEVVINHPDLEPDENGVGHIIFSPRSRPADSRLSSSRKHIAPKKKSKKGARKTEHGATYSWGRIGRPDEEEIKP